MVKLGRPRVSLHLLLALLFCLVLPSASWVDGSGWLAWTMFSGSATYRVRATAWDRAGAARPVAPTELAALAGGNLAVFLAGSERWRRAPIGPALAREAPALVALACRSRDVARVQITIEYRLNLDDSPRATSVERKCPVAGT